MICRRRYYFQMIRMKILRSNRHLNAMNPTMKRKTTTMMNYCCYCLNRSRTTSLSLSLMGAEFPNGLSCCSTTSRLNVSLYFLKSCATDAKLHR